MKSAPPTITATCSPLHDGQERINILFESTMNELRLARVASAVKPFAAPGTEVRKDGRMVRVIVETHSADNLDRVLAKALELIPELKVCRTPCNSPKHPARAKDASGTRS